MSGSFSVTKRASLPLAITTLLILISHEVRAQSAWPAMSGGSYLEANFTHPFIDQDDVPLGSLVLAGRLAISPSVRVVAEIPLASGVEWSQGDVKRNLGIGNVYVGIDASTQSTGSSVDLLTEVGVTLPLVGDDAEYLEGLVYTQFIERPSSWMNNVITVGLDEFVGVPLSDQIALQFRLGPSFLIPTEEGPDTEILAVYGARLRFESSAFAAGFGLSAWSLVTEDDASFDERTFQHLVFEAEYETTSITPFLGMRMGIGGEDDDYLDGGFLLSIGARMRIRK